MTQVHQDLKKALLEWRQLQKVDAYLTQLTDRLRKETILINKLGTVLKKEEKDLEELKSSGLRSLFYKILGDKEKQIEKERQQYLQSALKYSELSKSVDLIEYECELLEKKLDRFDQVKEEYERLIKLRENELLHSNTPEGRMILALSKEIDGRVIELKDMDEAIDAGINALDLVSVLEMRLEKASDWGEWDMHGNRHGAGRMKHKSVDQARDVLHGVRHALIRFQQELSDVYDDAYIDVNLRMGRFDSFFDIFFDNLITDWIVQQKIKNALDNVLKTKSQVTYALNKLQSDAPKVNKEIVELERRHRQEIIDASS